MLKLEFVKFIIIFPKRKRLNGGTVPPFKMHHGGTVPPFKMHHGGTVPPFKMHRGGTMTFAKTMFWSNWKNSKPYVTPLRLGLT